MDISINIFCGLDRRCTNPRIQFAHSTKLCTKAPHIFGSLFWNILYILESNPHPNLIRTSFCRFLKRKKYVSSRF